MGDKNKNSKNWGFTFIELLVVIAIIALLASVALIAFMTAREKSRNVKRLSDMTQMNTALELYFAENRGYPSSTSGIPLGITPNFAASLPQTPVPADGVCTGLTHSGDNCTQDDPSCSGVPFNTYFYAPTGTFSGNVYSDYSYYF